MDIIHLKGVQPMKQYSLVFKAEVLEENQKLKHPKL